MIRYYFPIKLPSLNEYTKACRTNAYAGAKMKAEAEEQLIWMIRQQGVHKAEGRNTVQFEWHEANRKRDLDNIAFGKKFILDALVTAGVLEGDGQKYVGSFTEWAIVDGKYGVDVTLYEEFWVGNDGL